MSSSGCEQLSPLSFTSELLLPCALVPVRSLRMEKTLRSCGVARGGMAGVGCGGGNWPRGFLLALDPERSRNRCSDQETLQSRFSYWAQTLVKGRRVSYWLLGVRSICLSQRINYRSSETGRSTLAWRQLCLSLIFPFIGKGSLLAICSLGVLLRTEGKLKGTLLIYLLSFPFGHSTGLK